MALVAAARGGAKQATAVISEAFVGAGKTYARRALVVFGSASDGGALCIRTRGFSSGGGNCSGPKTFSDFRNIEMNLTKMHRQLKSQEELQNRKNQEQQAFDEILNKRKAAVEEREKRSEDMAKRSEDRAKQAEDRAKQAEDRAKQSEDEDRAKQAEDRAKQAEDRAKQAEEQSEDMAKQSEDRAKQAEDRAKQAEEKQKEAEWKQQEAKQKQRDAEAKRQEAEKKSWFHKILEWIRRHNGSVYSMSLGGFVTLVVLEGGRPISFEFFSNLFNVCKETFLKTPIQMVAEARRRTDGKPVEETITVSIVLAVEGHAVKVSEAQLTKAELRVIQETLSARSSVATDSKKSTQ